MSSKLSHASKRGRERRKTRDGREKKKCIYEEETAYCKSKNYRHSWNRLAGRVRHGLRALRHCMLRQLSRQHNAHSRLHLAGTEGALLVRAHDRCSLRCDALHHVVHVRVHDPHRAARHRHLAVDCLEGAVDVHVPRTLRLAVRLARSLGGSRARSGHDCEGGKRRNEDVSDRHKNLQNSGHQRD